MGEHYSADLLPEDFAVTDVYRETFEELYQKLLDEAAYLYHRAKNKLWQIDPEDIANHHDVLAVINEFREMIVKPLMAEPELDPYVLQGSSSNARTKALLDYVRASCAWAITGQKACVAGDEHKGWVCMCRAQYWLGRANQVAGLPTAVKRDTSKRAQAGANAKHAHNRKAESFVLREAQRRVTEFTSAKKAGEALVDDVNSYLATLWKIAEDGDPLYDTDEPPTVTARTIRGWLKDIDFKH